METKLLTYDKPKTLADEIDELLKDWEPTPSPVDWLIVDYRPGFIDCNGRFVW